MVSDGRRGFGGESSERDKNEEPEDVNKALGIALWNNSIKKIIKDI